VGRLDYHSEGLMIFTNDGDFAHIIMHPRYGIEKEYLVKCKGILTKNEMELVKKGITIDSELYKVDEIRSTGAAQKNAWYRVVVSEGKNRMIRKIGEAVGHPVLKLKRDRIGKLRIGNLKPGEYRYFERNEAIGASKQEPKERIK